MDIPCTMDLPPVPICFSKLLVHETESCALPSQPWRDAERLHELKDIMLQSFAIESLPNTKLFTGTDIKSPETGHDSMGDKTDYECSDLEDDRATTPEQSTHLYASVTSARLVCRFNAATTRLKQEMVDLRHLDMSLFCQLLSLNEAMQDFKAAINDRYSEYTGSEYTYSEYASSEYSFGAGLDSLGGSFSSLTEESEWDGDHKTYQEKPNGLLFPGEEPGDLIQNATDRLPTSTTSLLQQITALTQRAEADF